MISSSFRFWIDMAMAIDTARGSPSGIATIRSTTPEIAILPISRRVWFSNIFYSEKRHLMSKKIT